MDRLEKLKELEDTLKAAIDDCELKELPQLAKQYRETIREIAELEGESNGGDEIAELLQRRDDDGKPGAVRKNSA